MNEKSSGEKLKKIQCFCDKNSNMNKTWDNLKV